MGRSRKFCSLAYINNVACWGGGLTVRNFRRAASLWISVGIRSYGPQDGTCTLDCFNMDVFIVTDNGNTQKLQVCRTEHPTCWELSQ
jgi:hypothetical protein